MEISETHEDGMSTYYIEVEDDVYEELLTKANELNMGLEEYVTMILEKALAEELAKLAETEKE